MFFVFQIVTLLSKRWPHIVPVVIVSFSYNEELSGNTETDLMNLPITCATFPIKASYERRGK